MLAENLRDRVTGLSVIFRSANCEDLRGHHTVNTLSSPLYFPRRIRLAHFSSRCRATSTPTFHRDRTGIPNFRCRPVKPLSRKDKKKLTVPYPPNFRCRGLMHLPLCGKISCLASGSRVYRWLKIVAEVTATHARRKQGGSTDFWLVEGEGPRILPKTVQVGSPVRSTVGVCYVAVHIRRHIPRFRILFRAPFRCLFSFYLCPFGLFHRVCLFLGAARFSILERSRKEASCAASKNKNKKVLPTYSSGRQEIYRDF